MFTNVMSRTLAKYANKTVLPTALSNATGIRKISWGSASIKNRRPYQEDHLFYHQYGKGGGVFGIADGHGSDRVASYMVGAFPDVFNDYYCGQSLTKGEILTKTFHELESSLTHFAEPPHLEGSTLTVAMVEGREVTLAHTGDSPAFLWSKTGVTSLLTPHSLELEQEEERILTHGGEIYEINGCLRVDGMLNISRSFGDFALKDSGVIATPQITSLSLGWDDWALVLASDGLTEAGFLEREMEDILHGARSPQEASEKLVASAQRKGASDNISVIVAPLFVKN